MTDNIQEEIEDKVMDYIDSEVGGRLITFKPEKSNLGANLAIERRGKYKEKEMYFQINSLVEPVEGDNFVKDFLQESFKTDKNFYLLFLTFDEVKQKVGDYIWLIPSLQFRDLAQVVKSLEGKNLLRFESSLDVKNKNKYSKFIVDTKELGTLILDAFEKGGKFDFQKMGLKEKIVINLESLKVFLCEARRNTYAADVIPVGNPRLLASKQLEFQKGYYSYRDIYFPGDRKIIGQEIVYQDLKPIWGMNYIGDQIGKLETDFLKESLFKLSEKCRFGGACEYEKREFKYRDKGQGSLEEFSGQEEILLEGKNIYKLDYRGRNNHLVSNFVAQKSPTDR